jgi:sugar phosphate isomerase/epimerase
VSDPVPALSKLVEKMLERLPARGCAIALQAPASRILSADIAADLLESFDDPRLVVCLDAGHAHLWGGAVEAAEAFSGLIATVLLHDNNGHEDLHRPPGAGTINWPEVLTACWKTGFDGPWMFDIAEEKPPADGLARAVGARTRLQAILEDLAQPMTFTE